MLLSAFANVKKARKALDLGTGTGILPIALEAKYPNAIMQDWRFRRERRCNSGCNGLEERIDIVTGDIKEATSIFGCPLWSYYDQSRT